MGRYTLDLQLQETTLSVGMYQRPRLYLLEPGFPEFTVEIPDPVMTVSGGIGYIATMPSGTTIFVATTIGTGQISATLTVDGSVLSTVVDVEVTTTGSYSIDRDAHLTTTKTLRSSLPYAQYSGYDKGVKRPFDSKEENESENAVQETPIAEAGLVEIVTPYIVMSLDFDASNFPKPTSEGFGVEWGKP